MHMTHPVSKRRLLTVGIIGLSAGIINALLGAAGGVLLIYTMPWFLKEREPLPVPFCHEMTPLLEYRDHMAISLAIMVPVTAVSFVLYQANGIATDLSSIKWLALPAASGGLIGAWLLGRIQSDLLKTFFAVIVILSGLRMLL